MFKKKVLTVITLATGVLITVGAILLVQSKSYTKDIEIVNNYVLSTLQGKEQPTLEGVRLSEQAEHILITYKDTLKEKYPNYVNMSILDTIYSDSIGFVNSESVEDADAEEIELSEEKLKEILGDDYKERLKDDYVEEIEEDARLQQLDGNIVIYTEDLEVNEQGEDYVTYNGVTHVITLDELPKSYDDIIGKQDYNFVLTKTTEYKDANKRYTDMLFTSITRKNSLKIRYYLGKEVIEKVEVTILEGD